LAACVLFGALSSPGTVQRLDNKADNLSSPEYVGSILDKDNAWLDPLLAILGSEPVEAIAEAIEAHPEAYTELKIIEEWMAQDGLLDAGSFSPEAVKRPFDELGADGSELALEMDRLLQSGTPVTDPQVIELYLQACEKRRAKRFSKHLPVLRKIVFTKHFDMGGSHYAYTEALSDANSERNITPGASLCVLESDGIYGEVRTLIDEPNGVVRDPDVSYDGKRILFSWKKSVLEDDYHLYEMEVSSGKIRQLTFGLGYADYEGVYLPNGDIVFNSTRCVQSVDCWWTEVSNLFTCDGDGKYMRRLTFDQVHTNYPQVTPDGRIIYTRWDYSDRGQMFVQGLFQMFPNGTGQTEFYGNNSWYPNSILHARAIPGTNKVVGIFSGHHTLQKGWLGIIDPTLGRQENSGAQLICPIRPAEPVPDPAKNQDALDYYAQTGDQFQYPYPLSEREFLVTYKRDGQPWFVIAFVTDDGKREVLAADPDNSCNQPIPLAPRPKPHIRPSSVDYRKTDGAVFMENIYLGPGLKGIPRGTIKELRVVALEFRAGAVGVNGNVGEAGWSDVTTPISIRGACDVKKVLGTTPVLEDGSAFFIIPARTPVYFQALDEKGHVVQNMRSWITLQPGETASCVGCHESKNTVPVSSKLAKAMEAGPQPLKLWQGEPRGFSFAKEIQPILDKHCVSCHNADQGAALSYTGKTTPDPETGRKWSDSYLALANRDYVDWIDPQSGPPMRAPYSHGAAKSKLVAMLEQGHMGVELSKDEMERICCWIDLLVPYCGDYMEGFEGEFLEKYQRFLDKRKRWEAEEARNIEELIKVRYGGGR
ncbi:MAG TPA: hypothetical protein PLP86_06090, partial [Armatimonadota bacterium]|nr:hypothetical protein [Armatimonadota bacterium]